MPERLAKHKDRSHWRERLADFRESIEKREPRRFELMLMVCLVAGLTVLLCSAYLPALRGFAEGDLAPRAITAEKTVYVVNIAETEKAKAQVAKTVPKAYVPVADAQTTAASELDAFLTKVIDLRDGTATVDEATAELGQALPGSVTAGTLGYLLTVDSASFDLLRTEAILALTKLYQDTRITDADTIDAARVVLRSGVDEWAASTESSATLADALYAVAAGFVRENWVEDQAKTAALQRAATDQVAPILTPVDKGDGRHTAGRGGRRAGRLSPCRPSVWTRARYGWKVWLGIFLVVLLEAVVFSRLLHRFHKGTKEVTNTMLLAVVILLLGGTADRAGPHHRPTLGLRDTRRRHGHGGLGDTECPQRAAAA